jgi:hypothetical protein
MYSFEVPGIAMDDLVLESIDGQTRAVAGSGAATFRIDTRSGVERRKCEERRHDIRFEGCRRNSSTDRRAGAKAWKPGGDF